MNAKLLAPIIAIILCSAIVFADEEVPRVLPSSPLWGLKLAFEKVSELFSDKKKVEHAQERLKELRAEIRRGNAEAAQKALVQARKAEMKNLLKAEDTENANKQFNEKFTIDFTKLQEAINKNPDTTTALRSYAGITALHIDYPNEDTRFYKIIIDEEGKISEITKTDALTFDHQYFFTLSHGQLYAYSQQIVEGKGNNLVKLLNVAGRVRGKNV